MVNYWEGGLRCFDGMMSRGQGKVYKYKDKTSKEQVVIKKYGKPSDETSFESERSLLKSLHSEHIVRYYDSFLTKDKEYWVGPF